MGIDLTCKLMLLTAYVRSSMFKNWIWLRLLRALGLRHHRGSISHWVLACWRGIGRLLLGERMGVSLVKRERGLPGRGEMEGISDCW